MSLVKPGEGFGFNNVATLAARPLSDFTQQSWWAELIAGPSVAVTGLRAAHLMANPTEDVSADVEVMSSLGVWDISLVKYFLVLIFLVLGTRTLSTSSFCSLRNLSTLFDYSGSLILVCLFSFWNSGEADSGACGSDLPSCLVFCHIFYFPLNIHWLMRDSFFLVSVCVCVCVINGVPMPLTCGNQDSFVTWVLLHGLQYN